MQQDLDANFGSKEWASPKQLHLITPYRAKKRGISINPNHVAKWAGNANHVWNGIVEWDGLTNQLTNKLTNKFV